MANNTDRTETSKLVKFGMDAVKPSASGNFKYENSDLAFSAFERYQRGQMADDERQEYERAVQAKEFPLPPGARGLPAFGGRAPRKEKPPVVASEDALRRYQAGVANDETVGDRLTREERMRFEQYVLQGRLVVPEGFKLAETEPRGILGGIKEAITGSERRTPETEGVEDWLAMPEVYSSPGTYAGTLISFTPDEIANVIKSNSPDVAVRTDAKGNYILTSNVDGKDYAIKPGFRESDVLRLGAMIVPSLLGGAGLGFLAKTVAGTAKIAPAIEAGKKLIDLNRATQAIGAAAGIAGTAITEQAGLEAARAPLVPGATKEAARNIALAGLIAPPVAAIGGVGGKVIRAAAESKAAAPLREAAQTIYGETVEPIAEAVRGGAAAVKKAAFESPPEPVFAPIVAEEVPVTKWRTTVAPSTTAPMAAPIPSAAPVGAPIASPFSKMIPILPPSPSPFARARPGEAAPFAVTRATPAVKPTMTAVEAFQKMEAETIAAKAAKVKPFIKEVSPDLPEPVADATATVVAGIDQEASGLSDDEFKKLVADASIQGPKGQSARDKLAENAKLNIDDLLKARAAGFDVPEEIFTDDTRFRQMIAMGISDPTMGKVAWKEATKKAADRASKIIEETGALIEEGKPAFSIWETAKGKELTKARDQLRSQESSLYSQVDKQMSGRQIKTPNLESYFKQRMVDVTLEGDEKELYDIVKKFPYKKYGDIERAKQKIEKALANIRKPLIGEKVPFAGTDYRTLLHLKRAIAKDQMLGIETVAGKDIAEKFQAAQVLSAQRKRAEKIILKTFGSAEILPNGELVGSMQQATRNAFEAVASGGGIKELRKIYNTLPEDMRSEWLKNGMALYFTKKGVSTSEDAWISPGNVIKFLENIDRTPFKNEFYKALGEQSSKDLEGLRKVMERIQLFSSIEERTGRALKEGIDKTIPEGTIGRLVASNAAKQITSFAAGAIGAAVVTPLAGPIPGVSAQIAGREGALRLMNAITSKEKTTVLFNKLIKDKDFLSDMFKAARGKLTDAELTAAANMPAFKQYAEELGVEKTSKARVSFLKWVLYGAGKAAKKGAAEAGKAAEYAIETGKGARLANVPIAIGRPAVVSEQQQGQ